YYLLKKLLLCGGNEMGKGGGGGGGRDGVVWGPHDVVKLIYRKMLSSLQELDFFKKNHIFLM
ncbi:hypothetical protein ACJX0J_008014, partial [Zea mays]